VGEVEGAEPGILTAEDACLPWWHRQAEHAEKIKGVSLCNLCVLSGKMGWLFSAISATSAVKDLG